MNLHVAHLLIAIACLSGIICANDIGASSSKARFTKNVANSKGSTRTRRQTFAFDEFGLPRFSFSQGSTVFQVARRDVGIPGSFLGSTSVFGNESPLLEHDAPQTTEQPRYGPNHPPGAFTVPPRYSTTSSANYVNSDSETSQPEIEQNASSVELSPDLLSVTDKVTDSPASPPISSTLPSDDLATVYGTPEGTNAPNFLSTKPSIPFPLTIDPATSGPSNATEQPSLLTSVSVTAAAPVPSTAPAECFCPCLTAPTYAPAQAVYTTPPSATYAPPVYTQAPTVPSYFPPPPPLRQSFTDILTPLRQPQGPALIFGPAPPRGSAGLVITPFPLPPDGQVGHPEPPPFGGDSNALEQPWTPSQDQRLRGYLPPLQFGVGQLSQVGHPEPPSAPLSYYASKLKSNGAFVCATTITSYLPVFLILCQLRLYL